jgi:hypothetical protein
MDPIKALEIVAEATQRENALLPKTASQLIAQWARGLTVLRFDSDHVIGHATLWPLTRDHWGRDWFELGTVWVHPAHRGHHLSAHMYVELFGNHPERNILATTTVYASILIGMRPEVGLVLVRYAALPEEVRQATCCCPAKKTGTVDNRFCQLRDARCFVRVTRQTWERLGSPVTMSVPAPPPPP